jgi:hypothetical protein
MSKISTEKKAAKNEDLGERSLSSRSNTRHQMESDIEAFLKKGGEIAKIPNNVMADPPRKPKSDYGSRPI